jgi:hypothetical protein
MPAHSFGSSRFSLASIKIQDPVSTQFPVFAEPLSSDDTKRFDRQTKGLSDEAVAYIKSLQPYNRPPGMPLGDSPTWVLHELNRIDKHRKILVRTAVAMNMTRTIAGPASEIVPSEAFRINENRYDAICSGAYKGLKPKLTVKVVFGKKKPVSQLHSEGSRDYTICR